MAPLNQKLPWFKPSKVPDEYHQDIENGKKPSQRYYIVKIKGWRETENQPDCEIIESIGEAGNLNAESMRILITYDICTESYENEDKQAN